MPTLQTGRFHAWRRALGALRPRPPCVHESPEASGEFCLDVETCALSPCFDPVIEVATGRQHGYQAALAVERGGWQVELEDLLPPACEAHEILSVDRLGAAVTAMSFRRLGLQGRLFLEVPGALPAHVNEAHADMVARVLRRFDIAPSDVLVELPEPALQDPMWAAHVIYSYRSCGFRISLNELSPGTAVPRRIRSVSPDMVKLSAATLRQAEHDTALRHHLRRAADAMKTLAGVPIGVAGVASPALARLAADLGADYAQGAFYGDCMRPCLPGLRSPVHADRAWVA